MANLSSVDTQWAKFENDSLLPGGTRVFIEGTIVMASKYILTKSVVGPIAFGFFPMLIAHTMAEASFRRGICNSLKGYVFVHLVASVALCTITAVAMLAIGGAPITAAMVGQLVLYLAAPTIVDTILNIMTAGLKKYMSSDIHKPIQYKPVRHFSKMIEKVISPKKESLQTA